MLLTPGSVYEAVTLLDTKVPIQKMLKFAREAKNFLCDSLLSPTAGKEELEEAEERGLLGPKAVVGEQATVLVSTHFTAAPAGGSDHHCPLSINIVGVSSNHHFIYSYACVSVI
jgi:hypothetical protein